ncbi:hypothetical protein O6H91_22G027400 [Diphasiastrum complanatum]|uniref:Uncharacterized protein n=1 Tax=Diphasiastrum complanatum TaxID=34168 RepID=A0ACC2AE83_DIPCM|nr:hypothetical protein O6H91_22G027400 [Diphasiastrum complanatum]
MELLRCGTAITIRARHVNQVRTVAATRCWNEGVAGGSSREFCSNMAMLQRSLPFSAEIRQGSSLSSISSKACLKDNMWLGLRQTACVVNSMKDEKYDLTFFHSLSLKCQRKYVLTPCRSSPCFMFSNFRTASSKTMLRRAGETDFTGITEKSMSDYSGGESSDKHDAKVLLQGEGESVLRTLTAEETGKFSIRGSSIDSEATRSTSSMKTDHVPEATRKLKAEFEAALACFQRIPEALESLPKMNPNGVYANHNLRLDLIHVYGFDYDYTLAHYTKNLQFLIYDLARDHLVKEHRYPESCLNFEYDASFPIRGLYYDQKKGYLLKLDFFHCAEPDGCFYGRRRLTRFEIEEAYGGIHISIEHMPNLVALMDLFCLSEDAVVEMLRTLKNRGKKLFILTNSPFPFVDGGMRFLFEEDGLAGDSWRELFDVVVALADKPNFYTSERPFRHYNSKKDILGFNRVETFLSQSVYYQGCLKQFLEITKWRGPEVLYFGDHLYSDLRGPAKAGWRTAAIIKELEREIATQNEMNYRFQQAKYHIVQELLGKFHGLPVTGPIGEEERQLLLALRKVRKESRLAMKAMFNPYFGSAFLTDTGKESAFAYNVQRYADVYTSRLENLMMYSSEAWLYTPFDVKILPHHIKVGPSKMFQVDKVS